jgi:DNA-binding HxlR family transcriptional regulator
MTRQELNCSMFRAMDALGDRWTLMVLREAFMGVRRFTDMQRDLGVARNVLTDRLNYLVDTGILERRQYQDRPVRFEYRLTDMGRDLQPALLTLMHWGDKYLSVDGAPALVEHKDCGHVTTPLLVCEHCREPLTTRNVQLQPGPGYIPGEDPAAERARAAREETAA